LYTSLLNEIDRLDTQETEQAKKLKEMTCDYIHLEKKYLEAKYQEDLYKAKISRRDKPPSPAADTSQKIERELLEDAWAIANNNIVPPCKQLEVGC